MESKCVRDFASVLCTGRGPFVFLRLCIALPSSVQSWRDEFAGYTLRAGLERFSASVLVTVRHMHAATAAAAPDYGGPTSTISKGNTRGEQAMYREDNYSPKSSLLHSLA
jgi:hypothetical protein